MDTGMELSLHITDIGANGDGVARTENGEVVFVPFTATGDLVMAEVAKDHDGILRGKITSVMVKSPMRAVPPCRHFGICGGCALQHINEESYRVYKKNLVVTALQKAGIVLPDVVEARFIPPMTRRRANFAARIVKGKAILGFHERKSGNIRDVPDCLLLHPSLKDMVDKVKTFLPTLIDEGKKIDVLIQQVEGHCEIGLTGQIGKARQSSYEQHEAIADFVNGLGLARLSRRDRDFNPYETLLEVHPLVKNFGAITVNVAPGAFLQPSEEGEDVLVELVTENIAHEKKVADLFCGNGTFTGPIFPGRDIVAADNATDAIASLRKSGVNAIERNLFKEPMSVKELAGVEAVILDPPRAGASSQVHALSDTAIPKIIYVSCNPQSFAKDAAVLQQGGYDLTKLAIVDQFIWSPHTELVGVFTQKR